MFNYMTLVLPSYLYPSCSFSISFVFFLVCNADFVRCHFEQKLRNHSIQWRCCYVNTRHSDWRRWLYRNGHNIYYNFDTSPVFRSWGYLYMNLICTCINGNLIHFKTIFLKIKTYFCIPYLYLFIVTDPPNFKVGETETKVKVPPLAANSEVGFTDTLGSIDEGKKQYC